MKPLAFDDSPKVALTGPKPPKGLGLEGRAFWLAIQREYAIGDQGGLALLATAAQAHQLAVDAEAQARAAGFDVRRSPRCVASASSAGGRARRHPHQTGRDESVAPGGRTTPETRTAGAMSDHRYPVSSRGGVAAVAPAGEPDGRADAHAGAPRAVHLRRSGRRPVLSI